MLSRINKISGADDKNRVHGKNKWDRMVDKEEEWFSDVYVTFSLSFSFKCFFYKLSVWKKITSRICTVEGSGITCRMEKKEE